jgi:signal-transduction protein with cAMP-binding, CBS, and nucleotidyltransferase domain
MMSLEQELRAERVSHLNLAGFCQIDAGATVAKVLRLMRDEGHNVCLIKEGKELVGIFTDRDVMRNIAASPDSWQLPVDHVMTRNPLTTSLDASAAEALWLMDDIHVRNLPVLDGDGGVVGNMTHRSVIEYLATRYPKEVQNRPPRPDQFSLVAEGG